MSLGTGAVEWATFLCRVIVTIGLYRSVYLQNEFPSACEPVVYQNVIFREGDGRIGQVVAVDVETGKELWKTEMFRVQLKPLLERTAVVFIDDLKLLDNALSVRDGESRCIDWTSQQGKPENKVPLIYLRSALSLQRRMGQCHPARD